VCVPKLELGNEFCLVPKLQLGNAVLEALLRRPGTAVCSPVGDLSPSTGANVQSGRRWVREAELPKCAFPSRSLGTSSDCPYEVKTARSDALNDLQRNGLFDWQALFDLVRNRDQPSIAKVLRRQFDGARDFDPFFFRRFGFLSCVWVGPACLSEG